MIIGRITPDFAYFMCMRISGNTGILLPVSCDYLIVIFYLFFGNLSHLF
ncbi:hypothetical protein SALWKB2_2089 [Snodgrassella alvi wkB2]|nr:hypothetical protein SALWKB2_2089 [Snodgrassella alvi wkB2]